MMSYGSYCNPNHTPVDAADYFARTAFTNNARTVVDLRGDWQGPTYFGLFMLDEGIHTYALTGKPGGWWSIDRINLEDGYAFKSTRRHPRDPETIVLPSEAKSMAHYVGWTHIDGSACAAFKYENRYYFQTLVSLGLSEMANRLR